MIPGLAIILLLLITGTPLYCLYFYHRHGRTGLDEYAVSSLEKYLLYGTGAYVTVLLISLLAGPADEIRGQGMLESVNLFLAPLIFIGFKQSIFKSASVNKLLVIFSSVLALSIHASTSHAASQPGMFPLAGQVLHLLIAAAWTGGAVLSVLMLSNTRRTSSDGSRTEIARDQALEFFSLSNIFLILMVVTGSILAVSNVHGLSVIGISTYGSLLKLKFWLFVIMLVLVIYILFRIMPAIRRRIRNSRSGSSARERLAVFLFAILLVLISIVSGMLTDRIAPATAPFINPQSWHFNTGEFQLRVDIQPVAGNIGNIRFEIFLPDELVQSGIGSVSYRFNISDNTFSPQSGEAIQVSSNSYQGEITFPSPGGWTMDLQIMLADGNQYVGSYVIDLPAQPLVEDLRTYLSMHAISYSNANLVTFVVGILLLILYAWISRSGQAANMPAWLPVTGLAGTMFGVYLVLSVVLVKTYPSTYLVNPVAYTANSINSGQSLYDQDCSECHAADGRGNGPWAVENRGLIPDISAPHMDVHTDGEIFWWLKHGIPSLKMPALGDKLSDEQVWSIINYVRSMRHGVPPG